MADNNDKLGVSYAMMCTIIGLFMMAGGTFVGCLLLGFGIFVGALCTLAVVILAGGGVFMAAKAKVEVSEKFGWSRFKGLGLTACFIGLLVSLWPTMTTVNFLGMNKELRLVASTDIDGLQAQLQDFDSGEKARLSATYQGMQNIVRYGNARFSEPLLVYLDSIGVIYRTASHNPVIDSVECSAWESSVRTRINRINIGDRDYKELFHNDISNLRSFMSSTDPALFAQFAQLLQTNAEQQAEKLNLFSQTLDLPVIGAGEESMDFRMGENLPRQYSFAPEAYAESYGKLTGFSWLGMAIALAGAALVTFYYFFTVKPLRGNLSHGAKKSDLYGLPLSSSK